MLLKEANAISVELRKKVQFEDFSFLSRLLFSFFLLFFSFVRPLQSGHIVITGRTDAELLFCEVNDYNWWSRDGTVVRAFASYQFDPVRVP